VSLKDAIVQVLGEADGPLHYREICKQVLERGLWKTSGMTPCDTVSARLATNTSLFVRTQRGIYDLAARNGMSSEQSDLATLPETLSQVTYLEAAELVLGQEPSNTSLHYRVITNRALQQNLIAPKGLTPEATMSAQLGSDIQRRAERGASPRFLKTGRGMYKIATVVDSPLNQQVESHNRRVRAQLHKQIKETDALKFEELIGMLLERLGFDNVVVTSKSNDGGIDVIGELVVADVIRTRMAVQVNRWASNVQRPEVQRVRGSLGVHDQGLIISTGGFSMGAREEANKPNAVLVALMDGNALVDQLIEHGIGVDKTPVTILELAPDTTDISPGV